VTRHETFVLISVVCLEKTRPTQWFESFFYPRCHFVQHGSTICFVVVVVVFVVVLVETLVKILLYSPILFNFTMLLQQ
jgi:hypothetical protein